MSKLDEAAIEFAQSLYPPDDVLSVREEALVWKSYKAGFMFALQTIESRRPSLENDLSHHPLVVIYYLKEIAGILIGQNKE